MDLDNIDNYQINIVLSARKLAEASFNETKNLDDIWYLPNLCIFSARKLAKASFNETKNLDDIDIYQINIVLSSRKLAEASLVVIL